MRRSALSAIVIFLGPLLCADAAYAQGMGIHALRIFVPSELMSFFVTSEAIGDGSNLGGLEGADAHCQKLAEAVDAGDRTWRAYLSTQATVDKPAINARDRIGQGPWYNANGVRIAANLGQLHGDTLALARKGNFINIRTAVTETGEMVPGEIRVVVPPLTSVPATMKSPFVAVSRPIASVAVGVGSSSACRKAPVVASNT